MRQVVVSQSSTFGGAERYLNRLFSILQSEGDAPFLIGHVPGWEDAGLPNTDVALGPKWSKSTMIGGLLRLLGERRRVLAALRSRRPDLFHLQFKREQIGFTKALSKLGPVVWTEHGQFLQGAAGTLLANRYRAAARHVATIICVSDAVASDVQAIVGTATDVRVIENGLGDGSSTPPTAHERKAARGQLGLPEDASVVLWIGRLHSAKRPELAVALGREFGGVVLVAGDGPERAELDRLSAGLGNVLVLGHLEQPEVAYRAADAVFFTSSSEAREGLPTTLAEAASHALPVVTVDDSGLDDLMLALGAQVVSLEAGPVAWAREVNAAIVGRESRQPILAAWAATHSEKAWVELHRTAFEAAAASWKQHSVDAGDNE